MSSEKTVKQIVRERDKILKEYTYRALIQLEPQLQLITEFVLDRIPVIQVLKWSDIIIDEQNYVTLLGAINEDFNAVDVLSNDITYFRLGIDYDLLVNGSNEEIIEYLTSRLSDVDADLNPHLNEQMDSALDDIATEINDTATQEQETDEILQELFRESIKSIKDEYYLHGSDTDLTDKIIVPETKKKIH